MEERPIKITCMDLWHCPKCGSKTNTYRHLYAKVWCSVCGYVLRKEGDWKVVHNGVEVE